MLYSVYINIFTGNTIDYTVHNVVRSTGLYTVLYYSQYANIDLTAGPSVAHTVNQSLFSLIYEVTYNQSFGTGAARSRVIWPEPDLYFFYRFCWGQMGLYFLFTLHTILVHTFIYFFKFCPGSSLII